MGHTDASPGTESRLDPQHGHPETPQKESDLDRHPPAIRYAVRSPGEAIHGAVDRGDFVGITRILQAAPDCVDARNARGRTPLHVAAQIGRNDIVKHLLQHGADVNARSGWKYTPLIFAAENSHTDVVVTLVRAGAQLEARTKSGNTAMHRAVLRDKNNPDTIFALAVFGADVNTKNDKGDPAIYTSVVEGKDANALVLCAFGADPSTTSSRSDSAADLVKRRGTKGTSESSIDMLQVLSTWTPEHNLQKYRYHLLLFFREDKAMDLLAMLCWASGKGHASIVNFVLQLSGGNAGSIVDCAETPRGWRPIHHAAYGGESSIAGILISHGAVVDSLTLKHKWTPLLLAAEKGRQRTVTSLLENHADILAETNEGKTAFELAGDGGHSKTLKVLGDFAMSISDHLRQQAALERFMKAKFSLKNSEVVIPSRRKSRARSREANPGSVGILQKPAGESPKSDSSNTLQQSAEPGLESQQRSTNPSPSCLVSDHQNTAHGSFDGGNGSLYSLPGRSSDLSQSEAFDMLIRIWDYLDYKERHDHPIKIAILDTGLDTSHSDFGHSRIVRFQNGQPVRAEGESPQCKRVRAYKDFTEPDPNSAQADMTDLDGHGTQIAGLILRLAPRADLYIARICEGNVQRGVLEPVTGSPRAVEKPRLDIAATAIEWAIQQKVDIINLSFGFSARLKGTLKDALKKAADKHILVFAAMSNGGNNNPYGAAWPASDTSLTIGIHSCVEKGKRSSAFTPSPIPSSHNFMVEGERVLTHWPEGKGGGFCFDDGTSFATPIAVSMAALILAFERQHLCKKEREEVGKHVEIDELRELHGMSRVLRQVSVPVLENGYGFSYIHPWLLWKDLNPLFSEDRDKIRKHAWSVIQDALSR